MGRLGRETRIMDGIKVTTRTTKIWGVYGLSLFHDNWANIGCARVSASALDES